MKRTLKSIIHEMTTNLENENRLSREEIFMFKQLNRRRSDFKTQKELMNFIDTLIFQKLVYQSNQQTKDLQI